jgi:ribonuclease HII
VTTTRARRTAGPRPRGRAPRLVVEAGLVDEGYLAVAGADEVGRGCLAGPVTVGVVVVDPAAGMPPRGLRDSKLLTPEQRRGLVPRIERWVLASSIASATAAEIDTYGIIAALRLAAHRALADLPSVPDCVLLDGNHDYLTPRPAQVATDQLALEVEVAPVRPVPDPVPLERHPVVRTRIKADLTCASVAAASVLAKASRDAFMVGLAREHPEYGWEVNKGYATPYHRAALRRLGPSPFHRVSWRLGLDGPDDLDALEELGELDELGGLGEGADPEELASLAEGADGLGPAETVSGAPVDLTDGQDGVVRLGEEVRR